MLNFYTCNLSVYPISWSDLKNYFFVILIGPNKRLNDKLYKKYNPNLQNLVVFRMSNPL